MPVAIAFECEVSERGIADFIKALSRYQRETQRDMRSALRSVTLAPREDAEVEEVHRAHGDFEVVPAAEVDQARA